jgi:hypothetical protein
MKRTRPAPDAPSSTDNGGTEPETDAATRRIEALRHLVTQFPEERLQSEDGRHAAARTIMRLQGARARQLDDEALTTALVQTHFSSSAFFAYWSTRAIPIFLGDMTHNAPPHREHDSDLLRLLRMLLLVPLRLRIGMAAHGVLEDTTFDCSYTVAETATLTLLSEALRRGLSGTGERRLFCSRAVPETDELRTWRFNLVGHLFLLTLSGLLTELRRRGEPTNSTALTRLLERWGHTLCSLRTDIRTRPHHGLGALVYIFSIDGPDRGSLVLQALLTRLGHGQDCAICRPLRTLFWDHPDGSATVAAAPAHEAEAPVLHIFNTMRRDLAEADAAEAERKRAAFYRSLMHGSQRGMEDMPFNFLSS